MDPVITPPTQSNEVSPKITAKQAAQIASNYFADVTSYGGGARLEEIEYLAPQNVWSITLSHQDSANPYTAIYMTKLDYKVFRVDADSGAVLSMKIRNGNV